MNNLLQSLRYKYLPHIILISNKESHKTFEVTLINTNSAARGVSSQQPVL